jgi:TPR repeat protein
MKKYPSSKPLAITLIACLLLSLAGCATPRRTEGAVTADTLEACRQAANAGQARAQYQLAQCYAEGVLVPRDQAEAFRWYQAAAAQGDAQARFQVGFRLANGLGVEPDQEKALGWLRLAGRQQAAEHRVAQFYRERVDSEEAIHNVMGGLLWMPLLIGSPPALARRGR